MEFNPYAAEGADPRGDIARSYSVNVNVEQIKQLEEQMNRMMEEKINSQMLMSQLEDEKMEMQQNYDELLEKNNELDKAFVEVKEESVSLREKLDSLKDLKTDYEYAKFQIEELQKELKATQERNEKIE